MNKEPKVKRQSIEANAGNKVDEATALKDDLVDIDMVIDAEREREMEYWHDYHQSIGAFDEDDDASDDSPEV